MQHPCLGPGGKRTCITAVHGLQRGLLQQPRHAQQQRLPCCHGRAVRVSAIQQPGPSNQEHGSSLEDYRRHRLRFGDRPSRQPRQQQPLQQPVSVDPLNLGSLLPYLLDRWRQVSSTCSDALGKVLYNYFNWRQDTSKDLVLIFMLFFGFVLLGGSTRHWVIDNEAERNVNGGFWNDVYQVCQWVFGQEFPGPGSPVAQQGFAVVTAMVGLAVFALVLALVEQVVLEGMEANVKRGSRVYETGHLLILGWCVSQRDLEVVRKVVQQICVAYKPEGGTKVVVLTQRSKLEMEGIFWRCLPAGKRYGTQVIFRQGSPLVPSDLKLVAASRANATVIVSDQSRSAAEADAQAVRCAILLDELDMLEARDNDVSERGRSSSSTSGTSARRGPAAGVASHLNEEQLDMSLLGRQVVVELKTSNALPLLKYACGNRIIALPTGQLNAQRLAKMVKRPVISIVSQQLFNFENGVSIFVHYYPHLVGHRFGELAYLFPDGIVMGVVDRVTGKARMAPSKDYVILGSQALVICRPTNISSHAYHPLEHTPNMAQLLHTYSNTVCEWVKRGPGKALYGNAQLNPAPTAADAAAVAAGSSSSSLTGSLPAAGSIASANAADISYEGFPAASDWSKAGLSQVEALRRQVEASCLYADGQQSSEDILPGADSASSGSSSSLMGQNNIVAANTSSRVDANSLVGMSRLVAASSLVTVSNAMGGSWGRQSVRAGAAATESAAAPEVSSCVGPISSAGSSRSSSPLPMQHQWPLSGPGNPPSSSSSYAGPVSTGSSSSSSSSGRRTPPGLRTTDWPVLSGSRHPVHRRGAPQGHSLWHLPSWPRFNKQRHQQGQQRYVPMPSAAGLFAGAAASTVAAVDHVQLTDADILVPSEYLQVDEGAERVLVLGWGPSSLMADLIKELDHGLSALPGGSEVVFVNTHSPDDSLGAVLANISLDYIKVRHVGANPLQRSSLANKLDMSLFRCALVLCDELWVDPDSNESNGIDSLDEPSVLRLDSLVMVTQLNIRKLLEDSRLPPINIICQKVATEGLTRFEDRNRLPLGISVNFNSFSAKMLTQIAANPLMLYPVTRLGEDAQLTIVDSSAYAALHECINFWQLVARCQEVGDVLLGYYAIPDHLDEPLTTVVDPLGMEERCKPQVWNTGSGKLKFIVLRGMHTHHHSSSSGSVDDMELETTQRAHWVASRRRVPGTGDTTDNSPIPSSSDSSKDDSVNDG